MILTITSTETLPYNKASPADPKRYSKRGVTELDLKAVKVTEIVKLIEDRYSGISFTDDSFLKKTDGALENLYLWMSNRSGNMFVMAANIT